MLHVSVLSSGAGMDKVDAGFMDVIVREAIEHHNRSEIMLIRVRVLKYKGEFKGINRVD